MNELFSQRREISSFGKVTSLRKTLVVLTTTRATMSPQTEKSLTERNMAGINDTFFVMSFRVRHLCISTFENYNILFPLTDRFITIVWTSKKLWKIFAYHNSVSTLSLLFPYKNRIHFITVVNFCDLLYQLFRRVNCVANVFTGVFTSKPFWMHVTVCYKGGRLHSLQRENHELFIESAAQAVIHCLP